MRDILVLLPRPWDFFMRNIVAGFIFSLNQFLTEVLSLIDKSEVSLRKKCGAPLS